MNSTTARKLIPLFVVMSIVFACAFAISTQTASAATYKILITKNTKPCALTVFKETNDGWKPVRTTVCAVGKAGTNSNATKTGTTKIYGKRNWFHMTNELFFINCWTRYNSRIWPTAYIHSPSYDGKNKALCRNSYQKSLGTHATHGCCRVNLMQAKWIYENCRKGTVVIVDDKIKKFSKVKLSNNYPSMGAPHKVKYKSTSGHAWAPTDPDPKNPYFTMVPVQIFIAKDKNRTPLYGEYPYVFDWVYAVDPNTSGSRGNYYKNKKLTNKNKNIVHTKLKALGCNYVTNLMKAKIKDPDGNWIAGGPGYKNYESKDEIGVLNITKKGVYTITYYAMDPYTMKTGTKAAKANEKKVRKTLKVTLSDQAQEITVPETISQSDLFKDVTAKGVLGDDLSYLANCKIYEVAEDGTETELTTVKKNGEEAVGYPFELGKKYKLVYGTEADKANFILACTEETVVKFTLPEDGQYVAKTVYIEGDGSVVIPEEPQPTQSSVEEETAGESIDALLESEGEEMTVEDIVGDPEM